MNAKLKIFISAFVFISVTIACIIGAQQVDEAAGLVWYSVIPPLLAVTLAILTARFFLSLSVAVGASIVLSWVKHYLMAGEPAASLIPNFFGEVLWFAGKVILDLENIWMAIFVFLILSMISVVVSSGGMGGIVVWLSRFATGTRSTQVVTALIGVFVFIGDYTSAMLTGPSMRPMTDRFRVCREKLAYIVDSTSAPITGLAFVSTWIGVEVGLFSDVSESLQLGRDGYSMFFDALGFRFYCILTVTFVIINALSGRDYGAMRKASIRARETGAVSAPNAKILGDAAAFTSAPNVVMQPLSAILPLVTLFTILLSGLWLTAVWVRGEGSGFIFSPAAWQAVLAKINAEGRELGFILSLSAWRNVLTTLKTVQILRMLACAACGSLFVAILCARGLSKLQLPDIRTAVLAGLKGSLVPLGILLFVWGLKTGCKRLETGQFLALILEGKVPALVFPMLVFATGAACSFATGSSWSTMAILIPTAIPVAYAMDGDTYGLTTLICLGATLDGAIFGDHCSPISDTTVFSAIASSCDALHHVRTQLPYAITVAFIALVCGYFLAALGLFSPLCILAGTGVIALLFFGICRLRDEAEAA
ncbi:hypothetical protein C6495_07200 [Candidatus Poribacteria bacterium]|nr:MAG: hypothetical protein C6495_07200 [Candidatus Poribacteria bacterium]